MRSSRGIRAGLVVLMFTSGVVVAAVAQAHSCSPSADAPVDIGANVRAHGEIDCNGNEDADILTVKLWRRISFYPDDNWGQTQDGTPDSSNIYSATVTACEVADPPDDFLTETRGNGSLHNVLADAISGSSNLDC
jgi:hypothetical protein